MSSKDASSSALRILDANLNRAREALRVMEDFARFVLNDAGLSRAIKEARHLLAETIPRQVSAELLHRREIVNDVGRDSKTQSEFVRATANEVVAAAGKRLSEALRSIEEYAKTFDRGFAEAIERIRYRGYELEQRLALTAAAREKFKGVRLYVLLTESLCHGDWYKTARAVVENGADCLQLREKELPDCELLRRAERLTALCRNRGVAFVVNDRPDIAAICHADGVHLGQHDLPVSAARRLLPATALVGVSTHTMEQIEAAAEQCPDYIAVGPSFKSTTKPQPSVAGLGLLAEAVKRTSLPLVAIGGIDEKNAPEVLAVAPCSLCVCSAVISRPDPGAATRSFRTILEQS